MEEKEQVQEQEPKEIKVSTLKRLFFAALVGYIFVLGFYLYYFMSLGISNRQEVWGQFGDFIGGVLNPIYALLAFGTLLWTIHIQSTELKFSRKELKNSSDALADQSKLIERQNFENTLFHMLQMHNEIVNSIEIGSTTVRIMEGKSLGAGFKETKSQGRTAFKDIRNDLRNKCSDINDKKDLLEELAVSYILFWREYELELSHYFRHLYRIFKHIDDSAVENKKEYAGIVRAQLSNLELNILFYNCLSPEGVENFKPLAEKYAMFDNLPLKLLFDPKHAFFYKKEAWGENTGYKNLIKEQEQSDSPTQ